jgi:hypothetical protein
MKDMNKIKILLIDDRPGFAYKSEFAFDHIPVMKDDTDGQYPEFKEFFDVQWLQSPEDTKEFRDYCIRYESQYSSVELGKTLVVPDIILFDYALSGETAKQLLPGALDKMPNVILGRILNDKSYRENKSKKIRAPNITEKNNELSSDVLKELNRIGHDNMGCFSGGLIYSLFRNHPCSAVPTTRKFITHGIEGTHTEYFEWLIKDELYEATDLKGLEVKWSKVIPVAAFNLRRNIEIQIRNRKITPFLNELAHLASGSFMQDDSKRIFSYNGVYGVKVLPVDGLFVDVPKFKRNEVIQQWAEAIFKESFAASSFRPENLIIDTARKHAETLWGAYQSELFWHRMNFSKMQKLVKEGKIEEMKEPEIRKYENYVNGDIKDFRVKRKPKTFEYQNAVDLGGLLQKKIPAYDIEDKKLISWTTLFVILKTYKARMDYLKRNGIQDSMAPTETEIITILFPLPATPDILPIHGGDMSNSKGFLNEMFVFGNKKNEQSKPFDDLIAANEGFYDEPTKFLLRCYAEGIGLKENEYFPQWIKPEYHE